MRYSLLLLALIVGLAGSAQLQLRHGPRLGLSMASRSAGGQLLQWTGLPKFGPIYGWSFDVPISDQIHVLVEPMMMTKGSWTRNAQWNTNDYITMRYLELPVLMKLSTNPDPQGLFLSGGMIYGYAMGGRYRQVRDGQTVIDNKYDFSGSSNRSQWNVALGLGYEKRNLMWEMRIQQSITPLTPFVRAQDLVVGFHFTWRLPLTTKQKEQEG